MAIVSNLTDDDEAPLELFDYVLSEVKNKSEERKQSINVFLQEMGVQIDKVIKKLAIDSEKTKKNVE